ncbi:MAG: hypothetical protein ACREL7_06025 [Longimicrobiales bacterium]
MGRRPKNVNESGRWTVQVGEHGSIVRVRERTPKGRLILIYGDSATGKRVQKYARVETVRTPSGAIEPELVDAVVAEAREKATQLRLSRAVEAIEPARITVGQGFRRFHGERGGLPGSRSGLNHHWAARAFWEHQLRTSQPWNEILPADVDAALKRLLENGKIPTAEKYVRIMRTVTRWLRDKAGFDGIKDPTRHLNLQKLREGHVVRRPRYSRDELSRLMAVANEVDPRFRFALLWADDTGARSAALYRAMRSGLDTHLDVMPSQGAAPFGWCVLPGMKGAAPASVLPDGATAARARAGDLEAVERGPLRSRLSLGA